MQILLSQCSSPSKYFHTEGKSTDHSRKHTQRFGSILYATLYTSQWYIHESSTGVTFKEPPSGRFFFSILESALLPCPKICKIRYHIAPLPWNIFINEDLEVTEKNGYVLCLSLCTFRYYDNENGTDIATTVPPSGGFFYLGRNYYAELNTFQKYWFNSTSI